MWPLSDRSISAYLSTELYLRQYFWSRVCIHASPVGLILSPVVWFGKSSTDRTGKEEEDYLKMLQKILQHRAWGGRGIVAIHSNSKMKQRPLIAYCILTQSKLENGYFGVATFFLVRFFWRHDVTLWLQAGLKLTVEPSAWNRRPPASALW